MNDQNAKKNTPSTPAKAVKSTPKKASSTPSQSNISTPAKSRRSTPKKTSATPTQNSTSTPAQAGPSTQNQGSTTQATPNNASASIQVVLDGHTEPYQGIRPIPTDLQSFANKINNALRDPANVKKLDHTKPRARSWLHEHDRLALFLAGNGYLDSDSTIFRFWMDDRLFTGWVWRNLATSDDREPTRTKELSSKKNGLRTAPAVARPGDPQRPSDWAEGKITADQGTPVVQLQSLVSGAGLGVAAGNFANNTPAAAASAAATATSSKRRVSKSGKEAYDEQKDGEEEEELEQEEEEEDEEDEENEDEPQEGSALTDSTKNADRGPSDSETDKPAPKKQKSLGKQKEASAEISEADESESSEDQRPRRGDPDISDSELSPHNQAMLPAFEKAIERKIEREAKEEKAKAEKAKGDGRKKGKK